MDDGLPRRHATRFGAGFRRLWLAGGLANAGDGIGSAATPLLAAALTRDPLLVAGVATAQRLPWLLFYAAGGLLLDRVDRRRVLMAANGVRALLLAAVAAALALDVMTLPLLYAAAFAAGTAEALVDNGMFALVPRLVPPDHLPHANGRLMGTEQAANGLLGPAIGGILFAVPMLPFALRAAAYAVAVLLLARLPTDAPRETMPRQTVVADLVEGFAWLWRRPVMRWLALGAAAFNLAANAGWAVAVLLARDVLGLGAAQFGLLAAGFGLGGIAVAFLAGRLTAAFGAGRVLFVSYASIGAAYLLIGSTGSAPLAVLAFVVAAFGSVTANVLVVGYRQTAIPDRLRGRVNGAYRTIGFGAAAAGTAVGGIVAGSFGLQAPYLAGAVVMLGLAVILPRLVTSGLSGTRAA